MHVCGYLVYYYLDYIIVVYLIMHVVQSIFYKSGKYFFYVGGDYAALKVEQGRKVK